MFRVSCRHGEAPTMLDEMAGPATAAEAASRERVAVIVPCYNEAVAIASVVADFRKALPHAAIYTKAAKIVGLPLNQILFIANHAFDCIGAKSAGMRAAFIDRRRRPFGHTPYQPDIIAQSMRELAELIA
jgi:beta-phosphoglucomutase-like phosphatase (HAD superfamily)